MKRLFNTLFTDRNAREAWEANLTWHRLRYEDARGVLKALRLLSRPGACGRVALRFEPGDPLSTLYLGVPAGYGLLLAEMAVDYAFSDTSRALPLFAEREGKGDTVVIIQQYKLAKQNGH